MFRIHRCLLLFPFCDLVSLGFSDDEKKSYRLIIIQNLIGSMQTLIDGAAKFKFDLTNDLKPAAALVMASSAWFALLVSVSFRGDLVVVCQL